MSHQRHVRHGTPIHDGPSLCESCRHAHIVRGLNINDDLVICGEMRRDNNRITFQVRHCTLYKNRNQPSLDMMREVAWELRTDRSGQKIGFMSQAEIRSLEKAGKTERLSPVRDPFTGESY